MERRNFIKLCSAAGLGVVASQMSGGVGSARAAGAKMFIQYNAAGGWDHSMFCDPKGNTVNGDGFAINEYGVDEIGQAGNITYAPTGLNASLFNTHYPIMTVLRGIDAQTNGHDSGSRATWSGRLQDNTPCLAALVAAVHGSAMPLAFLTNGGYDSTFGVPISRARLGSVDDLYPMIFPNEVFHNDDPDNTDEPTRFHTADTFKRITATRQARLQRMREKQQLPRLQRSMDLLFTSRLGQDDLKKIVDFLPADVDQLSNQDTRSAIALAAYKAGLCHAATFSQGGFDTHGNNDANQTNSLTTLVTGVMGLMQLITDMGLENEVLVVVGSDFGRTPRFNDAQGKDHWSVGAKLILDPSGSIPGNRVIGGTNEVGGYLKVDPATLGGTDGANGVVMQNGHIHRFLREELGVADSPITKLFPLSAEGELDLGKSV